MLTQIKLVNYKSFISETLSLSPMTLLAGLNNSGKSSIIQALRMIWQWTLIGEPTLAGHGFIKEMKNKSSSRSEPIKISCSLEESRQVEMSVNFNDSDQIVINSPTLSFQELPFMSYVSAERWGPRVSLPMYTAVGDLSHVGEHGEYVIDFLSRHERDIVPRELRHPLSEGDTVEYNVRAWLKEISPNISFKHGIDSQRDISFATIDEFRPPNTGFGLSYTLPVIVALLGMTAEWENSERQKLKSDQGALVLIENPEAHLHPKGQTSMGRMIALAASSGVQVIVETHSDYIMDGIRIAVKEGVLSSKKTIFHYLSLDKNGHTLLQSPKLESNGRLDYWPEGFFDQTLKNRALLARKE